MYMSQDKATQAIQAIQAALAEKKKQREATINYSSSLFLRYEDLPQSSKTCEECMKNKNMHHEWVDGMEERRSGYKFIIYKRLCSRDSEPGNFLYCDKDDNLKFFLVCLSIGSNEVIGEIIFTETLEEIVSIGKEIIAKEDQ
jgi:hypothetical protein